MILIVYTEQTIEVDDKFKGVTCYGDSPLRDELIETICEKTSASFYEVQEERPLITNVYAPDSAEEVVYEE